MKKYEHMDIAFRAELKTRAKFVLQCLAMHSNNEGQCFPSIKTIADECGYSVNTVKRALKDLEEAGFLKKQARFDVVKKNGAQTSNLYTLIEIEVPEKKAGNVPKDAVVLEKNLKEGNGECERNKTVTNINKNEMAEITVENENRVNRNVDISGELCKVKEGNTVEKNVNETGEVYFRKVNDVDRIVDNHEKNVDNYMLYVGDISNYYQWAPPGIRSEPP